MTLEPDISRTQLWLENIRLRREIARLTRQRLCLTCGGLGTIAGFWLGTVKRCPACDGKGRT